jgi:3-oxoacyl-[acyl-carrier-protein] synthase-1
MTGSGMRRVVVTGLGIKSSIGNSAGEVVESLRQGRSGIEHSTEYAELGFRSHVHGPIRLDLDALIDRKLRRFMGGAAAYAYLAMRDAIEDAGLDKPHVSSPRTGLIAGSGGSSTENMLLVTDTVREKGARKVGPTMVPRIMSSTCSACLAVAFGIQGVNYSISSACATSAHCIGNAFELIQNGKQDIIFAGGADELHWTTSILFDSMGALSSRYNGEPQRASRAFDADRDGFVISGGGGILVLEELEHARARNARIHAELVGYGAGSDGFDMVKPSGEGAVRCMRLALETVDTPVDYVNAHATSTPAGDIAELQALREVFGERVPRVNSTKSLSGHGLGAAGVNEAIFSLLMMKHDFICASANIDNLDEGALGFPIATSRIDNAGLRTVMSNSFGFGGTNATLVFRAFA